jgi:hypothetical protein
MWWRNCDEVVNVSVHPWLAAGQLRLYDFTANPGDFEGYYEGIYPAIDIAFTSVGYWGFFYSEWYRAYLAR